MNNKKRGHVLFLNSVLYSILTVVLMVMSIFKVSAPILIGAVLTFSIVLFSLILSMRFYADTNTEPMGGWVYVIGFIILIPLWCISTILTFITDILLKLFPAMEKDEGGDYYD